MQDRRLHIRIDAPARRATMAFQIEGIHAQSQLIQVRNQVMVLVHIALSIFRYAVLQQHRGARIRGCPAKPRDTRADIPTRWIPSIATHALLLLAGNRLGIPAAPHPRHR